MTSPVPVTTGTLAVPGARLHYELRGSGPLMAIVGSPMTAAPFTPLAELLAADRTVLTTDPRGHGGSALNDPEQDSTPRLRADDLARLIRHLGLGSAAVVGSSGGAVTTLALVQADPGLVTTAVAHEPPLAGLLETRDEARRAQDDMVATYLAGDRIGAWRKFVAFAGVAMPEEMLRQSFGGRDRELLAEDRYFFAHELRGTCRWIPDVEALRTSATRLVIGIGDTSPIPLCDKASRALTARLDIEPTLFPGGHDGMLADPAKFAARLREVIGDN